MAPSTSAPRRFGQHSHHEHLWRGLRNYDLQVVSTDHCPFCMKGQKELGRDSFAKVPNGMPGIETRLHLLFEAVAEGKLSLNRFVEIASTAPAKIFGLYPRKGSICGRRRCRRGGVGSQSARSS
jgi:dihydropyrimidinase